MEYDQIAKRLDWMDDQLRKDKDSISSLENRIIILEGEKTGLVKRVKEFTKYSLAVSGRPDSLKAPVVAAAHQEPLSVGPPPAIFCCILCLLSSILRPVQIRLLSQRELHSREQG